MLDWNLYGIVLQIAGILAYAVFVLAAVLTMATSIYAASRIAQRHPNYVLGVLGLVASLLVLLAPLAPGYVLGRLLDQYVIGVLAVCALAFDTVSITWIYGATNIYTDLEFSVGRPIRRAWLLMWCATPVLLAAVMVWWAATGGGASDDFQLLGVAMRMPRWLSVVVALAFVALWAAAQVYDQVDYNWCSMIREAAQSSTDWGPADPLVRHAWKQWRSVCEDTGQKDFTLRRRGTRDYTHSIKKGQYSRGGGGQRYGGAMGAAANARMATGSPSAVADVGGGGGRRSVVSSSSLSSSRGRRCGQRSYVGSLGSNSPNYSAGSMFEDSTIDEDVRTVDNRYATDEGDFGADATKDDQRQPSNTTAQKQYLYVQPAAAAVAQRHSQQHVQTKPTHQQQYQNVTKIEIVPDASDSSRNSISVAFGNRNPLARIVAVPSDGNVDGRSGKSNGSSPHATQPTASGHGVDHICWRKFSVNAQEFSTEL